MFKSRLESLKSKVMVPLNVRFASEIKEQIQLIADGGGYTFSDIARFAMELGVDSIVDSLKESVKDEEWFKAKEEAENANK